MEWNQLLKEERLAPEKYHDSTIWKRDNISISEFEKDYKKVISNSSFRRLQDKTQVFPLDKSDFVRTRLTHSIEVSMIAKQLGTMVCTYILNEKNKRNGIPLKDLFSFEINTVQHISEVLLCAGLIHDLGNPPFGHFGETVIGDWFKNRLPDESFTYNGKKISNFLTPQMQKDLMHFEGNAQSLRIILKAHNRNSNSDFNLTSAVLHTLMKYTAKSDCFNEDDPDIKLHKTGYFKAEEALLLKISDSLGTKQSDTITRHPLTFLLEAADDIAYATADLEDAFKKGLFTLEQFIDFFDNELKCLYVKYNVEIDEKTERLILPLRDALKKSTRSGEDDANLFNEWVKFARDWLMHCAAFGFTNNYKEIMEGTYCHDLFAGTFHELSIKALKNAMKEYAYHSHGIVKLELSAQTMIHSLLDKFIPAVLYLDDKEKQTPANRKFVDLISENYKIDYRNCRLNEGEEKAEKYNLYLRFLLVTDYISGMTDSYAKNLYQELNGII